jgi:hypothetical protein
MTRDDIIRMAREAWGLEFIPESDVPKLERFADLVAIKVAASEREWMQETNIKLIAEAVSAEREACAIVCEDMDDEYKGEDVLATWCAKAIRDRGVK